MMQLYSNVNVWSYSAGFQCFFQSTVQSFAVNIKRYWGWQVLFDSVKAHSQSELEPIVLSEWNDVLETWVSKISHQVPPSNQSQLVNQHFAVQFKTLICNEFWNLVQQSKLKHFTAL